MAKGAVMATISPPTKALWPAWYSPPTNPPFSASRIVLSVADCLGISGAAVTGQSRARLYVRARGVVAQILHERGWSSPMIGRVLGGRDHSTVLNLLDKFPVYCREEQVHAAYELYRCPRPGRLV